MVTVIGSHEVKDFAQWKTGFDSDEVNRTAAGMKTIGVYQAVENPNHVTFIFEAPSTEMVNGMMGDPAFHEKMKNAGVTSVPEVRMFTKA